MADTRFHIFTEEGWREVIEAPSLRKALAKFEGKSKVRIVGAFDEGSLPLEPAADRPFLAIFLRNPNFTPSEVPET